MLNIKKIIKVLPLLAIAVGFVGCVHDLRINSTPLLISDKDDIRCFLVVCFDRTNKPELRSHEIGIDEYERKIYSSESEFREAYNSDTLWKEDAHNSKKYTFYIPMNKRTAVEHALNVDAGSDMRRFEIKILEDDPVSRKQKIEVYLWSDDNDYWSIYAVDGNSITPLKYGDLTKRDGVVAAGVGLKYTLVFYVLCRFALWVAACFYARRSNLPES